VISDGAGRDSPQSVLAPAASNRPRQPRSPDSSAIPRFRPRDDDEATARPIDGSAPNTLDRRPHESRDDDEAGRGNPRRRITGHVALPIRPAGSRAIVRDRPCASGSRSQPSCDVRRRRHAATHDTHIPPQRCPL